MHYLIFVRNASTAALNSFGNSKNIMCLPKTKISELGACFVNQVCAVYVVKQLGIKAKRQFAGYKLVFFENTFFLTA